MVCETEKFQVYSNCSKGDGLLVFTIRPFLLWACWDHLASSQGTEVPPKQTISDVN